MEDNTSRPKRSSKPSSKFVPWEEGEAAMTSERKRKSRVKKSRPDQLEKNKLYMRNYREKDESDKKDDMEVEKENSKKKKTEVEKEKSLSKKENVAAVLKKRKTN